MLVVGFIVYGIILVYAFIVTLISTVPIRFIQRCFREVKFQKKCPEKLCCPPPPNCKCFCPPADYIGAAVITKTDVPTTTEQGRQYHIGKLSDVNLTTLDESPYEAIKLDQLVPSTIDFTSKPAWTGIMYEVDNVLSLGTNKVTVNGTKYICNKANCYRGPFRLYTKTDDGRPAEEISYDYRYYFAVLSKIKG